MNSAIIVAAGNGKRFGGEIPKQFRNLKGKPVLIHTIERFEKCEAIDEIVLVLSTNDLESFSSQVKKYKFQKLNKIVIGGNSRAESVFNGLKTIDEESASIIAIHDGARPLVTVKEITKTIKSATENGAACLLAEITDTIKEVSGDLIVKTIDRGNLRRALTPQCFRYDIIKRAFEVNEINEIATDECYLVEQMGIQVFAVKGSSKNIKITHEEDLSIAEFLLEKYK